MAVAVERVFCSIRAVLLGDRAAIDAMNVVDVPDLKGIVTEAVFH